MESIVWMDPPVWQSRADGGLLWSHVGGGLSWSHVGGGLSWSHVGGGLSWIACRRRSYGRVRRHGCEFARFGWRPRPWARCRNPELEFGHRTSKRVSPRSTGKA